MPKASKKLNLRPHTDLHSQQPYLCFSWIQFFCMAWYRRTCVHTCMHFCIASTIQSSLYDTFKSSHLSVWIYFSMKICFEEYLPDFHHIVYLRSWLRCQVEIAQVIFLKCWGNIKYCFTNILMCFMAFENLVEVVCPVYKAVWAEQHRMTENWLEMEFRSEKCVASATSVYFLFITMETKVAWIDPDLHSPSL